MQQPDAGPSNILASFYSPGPAWLAVGMRDWMELSEVDAANVAMAAVMHFQETTLQGRLIRAGEVGHVIVISVLAIKDY